MRCADCGSENREGRRFCARCGAALSRACPACGAANEPSDRFCGACGTGLAAEPAAETPAAVPQTQRRMVSVLFADLVGFTALAEARDPEEVRELLTRYFESARTAVERHGGVVEKFIGDAVMAVWGAPVAQEDDAERAVRVALELVDSVRALGERTGLALAARAAVATGDAAVTVGAVGQGIVAGDLVNTASRIQGAAPPGGVLVDDATRRMIEAAIACEPAGEFELKGKPEPVALWRAARVAAARRGVGRSVGVDPPFVGRDREFRLVKDLFHATAEGRRAHMLHVTGVAGIGKSRLAWEFEKYTDGLAGDVLWHRGRCLSYGEGVAFWALAEMVRMRARITDEDDPASAAAKIEATVGEWVSDPADREWVTPPLRHLVGLESGSAGDRGQLFPAWRRFVESMASRLPVVLVFEDMQWADESLLEFVEYLMEWARDHPLFVIALARPELAEGRPAWGAASRALTSLGLEPLRRDSMVQLVESMVPGLAAPAVERIADLGDGVPLYAVETVRMLLDRGVLRLEDGAFRAAGAITDVDVPDSLHALVAARLDGLPEDDRRLLQQASVLGKSFTSDGLTAVSGLQADAVEAALARLARRELVAVQTDPRSPDHGQYAFVQDVVRTIARDTLGRRERKRLHLASAAFLQEAAGEELAEVIAAHQLDAYRLVPDDADAPRLRGEARETLLAASERARSLAAPGEALRLVTLAIELTDDEGERAALLERGGHLAQAAGHVDEADRTFTDAIELFEQRGDAHAAARVRAYRDDARFLAGRADLAAAEMEEAYAVLSQQEEDAALAHLAAQLGRLRDFTGSGRPVLELLDRAIDIAEALGLPEVLSQALNTKALHLLNSGRQAEGRALMGGALQVALEANEHEATMRAYFNLSYDRERVDDLNHPYDEDGLALARRVGDRLWERAFLLHIAMLGMQRGEWDEAIDAAEQCLGTPGAESDAFSRVVRLWPIAIVHARRGDIAEARAAMAASGLAADVGDVQGRSGWASAEAELRMAEGRFEAAIEAAETAVAGSVAFGLAHPYVRGGLEALADCAARLGDTTRLQTQLDQLESVAPGRISPGLAAHRAFLRGLLADGDDADRCFRESAAMLRRIGSPWRLARTLEEHAAWLAARGRPGDAEEARAEVAAIHARLGVRPVAAEPPIATRAASGG